MRFLFLLFVLLTCCHQTQPGASRVYEAPGSSMEPEREFIPESLTPTTSKHLVPKGVSLSQILVQAGLDQRQKQEAVLLLGDHMDVHQLPAHTPYSITRSPQGGLRSITLELSPTQKVQVTLDTPVSVESHTRETHKETRLAQGFITHSLHASLVRLGHPTRLAPMLDDIFGSQIDFKRLAGGTCFQILYETRLLDGEPIGDQRIQAARIRHRGKTRQAFLFEEKGWNYYNEQGMPLNGGFLPSPVVPYPVSSPFSRRRFHPVLKRFTPHLGTDYAAPHGSKAVAVADGKILKIRFDRYNGNFVKIKHSDTYQTQYLHLSRFAKKLKEGQWVKMGQVIGYVGNTGLAAGTHLCFRLWKNGRQVDPRYHRPHFGGGRPAGPRFQQVAEALTEQLGVFPMPTHLNALNDLRSAP